MYFQDKNNADFLNKFQPLQVHLKATIEESKKKYCLRQSDKLLDSKTIPMWYWSILKDISK